jgi:drug/metabolite transporter (DMT)-like permease
MLFYLVAMTRAEASFVLGITAAYPLIVQIFAYFFLHEALVPERLLGSLLVGIGVGLVGSSAGSQETSKKHHTTTLLMCLIATLLWGITGLFDKKALSFDLPFKIYYARCVWDAVILVLMLLAFRLINHKVAYKSPKAWKYSGFSSICLSLGTLSYMFAMTMATASYVIVITGCYPLLMYLGALIFLNEKLSKMRLAGVILVVVGGLMVQNTQAL